eukprot:scaffold3154_cov129-Skeletonema_menzelii.AAC.1
MSSGNEGCSCINQTTVLASLDNRDCTTANGLPGIYISVDGSCVAYDYGSSACLQHDLIHDPNCQGDPSTAVVPPWCFQAWCYVDANSCKKNSEEVVFKSKYFPPQYDIFYSYSTCNSTNYFTQSTDTLSVAGGVNISVAVPELFYPMLNKQLPDGTILWTRTEDRKYYYDDTIPYGGIYIDYINSIVKLSDGDIHNMTFTYTSRASAKQHPRSSFTAAAQDVENGLVDMAVGPFWITGQRLRLTTFTVPLVSDKTVLVIPKPGTKNDLVFEIQKVLEPFTYGLWGVAVAITIVAALLSVWFSDREMAAKKRYGMQLKQSKKSTKRRKAVYFRLMLDAILEKGMFFFSAGIEQDTGAISAYVANLAAFLTQTGLEKGVGSMKEVIDGNIPICGHPALEEEIRMKWPDGKWVFPYDAANGFDSMLEAYARGDCKVLAIGREDTIMDMNYIKRVCELDLVYTDVLVTENPIAFPINPQLASAFSYWMYLGEKTYGIDLDNAKQKFIEKNDIKPQCEVELSQLSGSEELVHESKRKKGLKSSIGRSSSLDLYGIKKGIVRDEKLDEDDWVMPRAKAMVRRQTLDNSDVDRICDFPGANIPGDEFHENGAPQSFHGPKSILKGSIDDMVKANGDADEAVKEEDNNISHRIEEL